MPMQHPLSDTDMRYFQADILKSDLEQWKDKRRHSVAALAVDDADLPYHGE